MTVMQAVPELGSKVYVEGKDGVFVVVYVNLDRLTADLLAMDGTQRLDREIPLDSIRPV